MRPKQQQKTRHDDLFRARLDQIINMKHELVILADRIGWVWLDEQLAECFSSRARPAEQVWKRWVSDPYFQYFTGEEFFQHALPHERSGMSHWRKRIGDRLDILLQESLRIQANWRRRMMCGSRQSYARLARTAAMMAGRYAARNHLGQTVQVHERPDQVPAYPAGPDHPRHRALQNDGHLGRNFLKGRLGDQINALMSAVGYNLRLILKWLKLLLRKIIAAIHTAIMATSCLQMAS